VRILLEISGRWSIKKVWMVQSNIPGGRAMATINGTPGNDTLNGTAGNDVINGLAGNDRLNGRGGTTSMEGWVTTCFNDYMDGGPGTIRLRGPKAPTPCMARTATTSWKVTLTRVIRAEVRTM
jgi:hypothetical protein